MGVQLREESREGNRLERKKAAGSGGGGGERLVEGGCAPRLDLVARARVRILLYTYVTPRYDRPLFSFSAAIMLVSNY